MSTPQSSIGANVCRLYGPRIYKRRSRIVGCHDSEIDRYDTRVRMRAILDPTTIVTAPRFHTPPTHIFLHPDRGLQALRPAPREKKLQSHTPKLERNGATAHSDGHLYLRSVLPTYTGTRSKQISQSAIGRFLPYMVSATSSLGRPRRSAPSRRVLGYCIERLPRSLGSAKLLHEALGICVRVRECINTATRMTGGCPECHIIITNTYRGYAYAKYYR
ncbi:hypothetical protein EDB87DRAFT_765486 [Lactarius vividus]|nr:hypothetical protein EDB87DRAFT_765486 [Lactarius vividus]